MHILISVWQDADIPQEKGSHGISSPGETKEPFHARVPVWCPHWSDSAIPCAVALGFCSYYPDCARSLILLEVHYHWSLLQCMGGIWEGLRITSSLLRNTEKKTKEKKKQQNKTNQNNCSSVTIKDSEILNRVQESLNTQLKDIILSFEDWA